MNNRKKYNSISNVLGNGYATFSPQCESAVIWPRVFLIAWKMIDI